MHGLAADVRLAWRRLRATPIFTAFAVVTLALGIGVTTAIYSVIRAVMSPPPGVHEIERVANVYHAPGGFGTITLSWPDYQDFKSHHTVFENVTAWTFFREAVVANGHAETSFAELVGGEYFDVLRVRIAMGRPLQRSDDRVGAPPVAVISHQMWKRVFDGAPDVIGRVLKLNGHAFEIVGVAPATFRGLFNNGFIPTGLWVPLSSVPLLPNAGMGHTLDPANRERRWLLIKGRLKPGRTLAEAQTEAAGIARQLDAAYPIGRDVDPRRRAPYLVSRPWSVRAAGDVILNENADRIVRPLAVTLMVAVGLVLLIACTNLMNLTLARVSGRAHDVAVRLALGATRTRLARETLAETALLAIAGGVLSVVVTRLLLAAIGRELDVGRGATLQVVPVVDVAVLVASAVATVIALLVAGLGPALRSARADVRTALAAGATGGGTPRWRGRRALIATQVTVSLILLAIAALCVDQIRQQRRNDTGMALDRLALAQVDFDLQKYQGTQARQIVDAVLARIAREPDVDAVAASSGLPIGIFTPGASVKSAGQPAIAPVELMASTPGVFQTLGVAIVRGRALDSRDTAAAERTVILSGRTATALFGNMDVVGRSVILTRRRWAGGAPPKDEPVTIVGVAADTDTGSAGRRDHGTAYLSLDQHYEGRLVFSARTSGDPARLVMSIRQALAAVDPDVAVEEAGTGLAIAAPSNLSLEVTAGLAGVLGSFALVLALAGLYGALSHIVTQRTREIGVRVALGATRPQIVRMVVSDGLHPVILGVCAGVVLGLVARLALRPYFVRLLPGVDPFVIASAPAAMLVAALVACYLPARRAARVDPNVALRHL